MIGSFTECWKYAWADLWSVLARSRRAPVDLFVQLYREATDFLENEPTYQMLELAANDANHAQQAFEAIRGEDFGSEISIVQFMESAFGTLGELDVPRFEKLYAHLVRRFIRKYNLKYRVDRPFRLRLILPGVFAEFYDSLSRANRADPHLLQLMNNFESAFGSYARTREEHSLTASITNAFIYAEGLAGKTLGEDNTLGQLCDCLQCWPHATVRESLKKLYGFRNHYPGLGHAGNRIGKLRDLQPRDAVVVSLLILAFSGYLTDEVRIDEILAR